MPKLTLLYYKKWLAGIERITPSFWHTITFSPFFAFVSSISLSANSKPRTILSRVSRYFSLSLSPFYSFASIFLLSPLPPSAYSTEDCRPRCHLPPKSVPFSYGVPYPRGTLHLSRWVWCSTRSGSFFVTFECPANAHR